ncbi:MAG: DNA repair protein RecO [Eubacteriales bacterium]|nr:DNA repair protein RecO [Eubacteriales bacterium]
MDDTIEVSGMVLSSMPMGENDRRVVLLTRELGKVSAFATGARRQGNTLMAPTNPFVFGTFYLKPGRSAYKLVQVKVLDYFTEMAKMQPGVYYGYYFLEFAGYYMREGLDGTDTLNLLYLTVRALMKPELDDRLIRRIFELRLMTINGEYAPEASGISEGTLYTIQYIMQAPLTKLYTFAVTEEILRELSRTLERHMRRVLDRQIKSKQILEMMLD